MLVTYYMKPKKGNKLDIRKFLRRNWIVKICWSQQKESLDYLHIVGLPMVTRIQSMVTRIQLIKTCKLAMEN